VTFTSPSTVKVQTINHGKAGLYTFTVFGRVSLINLQSITVMLEVISTLPPPPPPPPKIPQPMANLTVIDP
jgi:hypothetical protein